jgi:hypothetical protein
MNLVLNDQSQDVFLTLVKVHLLRNFYVTVRKQFLLAIIAAGCSAVPF